METPRCPGCGRPLRVRRYQSGLEDAECSSADASQCERFGITRTVEVLLSMTREAALEIQAATRRTYRVSREEYEAAQRQRWADAKARRLAEKK